MSQSERIFYILRLFDERGGVTTRDVVQMFEVSERQAKRDIEYMRDRLGAPITWKRESNRYELSGLWALHPKLGNLDIESSYRRAFEAAHVALLLLNSESGRIVLANPAFESLLGIASAEIIGKTMGELGFAGFSNSAKAENGALSPAGFSKPISICLKGRDYLVSGTAMGGDHEAKHDESCILVAVVDITDVKHVGNSVVSDQAGRSSPLILVVDDDAMVRDVMEGLLQSLGYRVLLASSGQEAVNLHENNSHEVSLIILDVMMPGMSGLETFRELQKNHPDTPCVFLSGYAPSLDSDILSSPSVRGCLKKPISRLELSKALAKALSTG